MTDTSQLKRSNRHDMLRQVIPALKERAKEVNRRAKPYKDYERDLVLEHVWDRMAQGEILTDILIDIQLPMRTYQQWIADDGSEVSRYRRQCHARAREQLADWAFGEALRVAREIYLLGPDVEGAQVAGARLFSDNLKWYAQTQAPARYGQQKQELSITGPNGGPVQVAAVTIDVNSLSVEQREALRAALLGVTSIPEPAKMIDGSAETVGKSEG